jgi:hypothetical protein
MFVFMKYRILVSRSDSALYVEGALLRSQSEGRVFRLSHFVFFFTPPPPPPHENDNTWKYDKSTVVSFRNFLKLAFVIM